MTKNEQLRGLGRVASREPREPPKDLDHSQVQHPNHHDMIMPRYGESPAHGTCDRFWHGTGHMHSDSSSYSVSHFRQYFMLIPMVVGNLTNSSAQTYCPLAHCQWITVPTSGITARPIYAGRTGISFRVKANGHYAKCRGDVWRPVRTPAASRLISYTYERSTLTPRSPRSLRAALT